MLSSHKRTRSFLFALLAAVEFVVLSPNSATAQSGSERFHFLQYCAGCHRVDGSGVPPDVPNLRRDLAQLIKSPEGRDFVLRVPGVTGVPISTMDVAALLNWMVRTYYPDYSDFSGFTAEEVALGRARPLYDPLTYRQALFPELY